MSIITSDFIITGKHSYILNQLVSKKVFKSNAEGFVEAFFIGIYHGKKAEIDEGKGKKSEVSRLYLQNRSDLEKIMFTFIQLEKIYQKEAIDIKDVYLFGYDLPDYDAKSLINDMKSYALYGLEVLEKRYKDAFGNVDNERMVDLIINKQLLNEAQLKHQTLSDEKDLFYKSFIDEEINAIIYG